MYFADLSTVERVIKYIKWNAHKAVHVYGWWPIMEWWGQGKWTWKIKAEGFLFFFYSLSYRHKCLLWLSLVYLKYLNHHLKKTLEAYHCWVLRTVAGTEWVLNKYLPTKRRHEWRSLYLFSQSFKKFHMTVPEPWPKQVLISEFGTKRRFILKSVWERFACGMLVAHNVTSAYVS